MCERFIHLTRRRGVRWARNASMVCTSLIPASRPFHRTDDDATKLFLWSLYRAPLVWDGTVGGVRKPCGVKTRWLMILKTIVALALALLSARDSHWSCFWWLLCCWCVDNHQRRTWHTGFQFLLAGLVSNWVPYCQDIFHQRSYRCPVAGIFDIFLEGQLPGISLLVLSVGNSHGWCSLA